MQKLVTAKMLYHVAVNFIEYVMHIGKFNDAYNLSYRLDSFADEYRDFSESAHKLEQKIYPVLEYNMVEHF